MIEPCKYEREIGQMETKIDNLAGTIILLNTNVSALMKYVAGEQGIAIYKEKQGLTNRQRTGLYVSAIIGFSGIICALIIKFA